MKYISKWITFTKSKYINLDLTFNCGQSFNWVKLQTNDQISYFNDTVIHIKEVDQNIKQRVIDESLDNIDLKIIDNQLKTQFNFDLDSEKCIKLLRDCKIFKIKINDSNIGLRMTKMNEQDAMLTWIITQNNNIKRIKKIFNDFCKEYGELALEFDESFTKLFLEDYQQNGDKEYLKNLKIQNFPKLKNIETLVEQEFKNLGFGQRAKYMIDCINQISKINESNTEINQSLKEYYSEDCLIKIQQIKGIGQKVGCCICLFGFGIRELVPVDVHINRFCQTNLIKENRNDKITPEQINEAFKNEFGEQSGWIQQIIFYDAISKTVISSKDERDDRITVMAPTEYISNIKDV